MAATFLDAIQNIATQSMIDAATSTLGITEQAATSTLGASVINVLGAMIKRSGDNGAMATVASLVNGLPSETPTFANMTDILSGGPPVSAAQVAGNKLLSAVLGDKSASSIAAVAFSTGVNPQAASGLTTLAAPMVLAALRSKLGGATTAADVAALLKSNEGMIAANMPAPLKNFYGLAAAAAPAAAAAVAAPAAVKPAAPAPMAPAVSAKAAEDVLKSGSSYAKAAIAEGAAAAATVAASAAAAAKPAPAAPAPAPASKPAAAPVVPAAAEEGSDFDLLPIARIVLPLLFLGAMGWLWYHIATQAPPPKPAAPAPAAATAPAPAPAPAVTTAPAPAAPAPANAPAPAAPAPAASEPSK